MKESKKEITNDVLIAVRTITRAAYAVKESA